MADITFSIVIPTLNEEHFLPNLLNDLVLEKEELLEVIVVDGGSTDHTKEVVTTYSAKLPVHFFVNTKKNVAYQRNYGAEKSHGTYLIFFDADVRLTPGYIHNLRTYIEKNRRDLYVPTILPQSNKISLQFTMRMFNMLVLMSQILPHPMSTSGTLIIKKEIFVSLHGFDETLFIAEDHDLIQRLKRKGIKAQILFSFPILMSVRRTERENPIGLFIKYTYTTLYYLFKGRIEKKIVSYEMGGQISP